jgi:hypothetical protein
MRIVPIQGRNDSNLGKPHFSLGRHYEHALLWDKQSVACFLHHINLFHRLYLFTIQWLLCSLSLFLWNKWDSYSISTRSWTWIQSKLAVSTSRNVLVCPCCFSGHKQMLNSGWYHFINNLLTMHDSNLFFMFLFLFYCFSCCSNFYLFPDVRALTWRYFLPKNSSSFLRWRSSCHSLLCWDLQVYHIWTIPNIS